MKGSVVKSEILTLLRETGDFVSGQELCQRFQVSRTAIWKVMNQLKEEGYDIEAVPKKGYRMVAITDVLSKEELESLLTTKWLGRKIYFYDKVGSTNKVLTDFANQEEPQGTLVVANEQTAGKGRRGKDWISASKAGIWMSFLLRPAIHPEKASMLTLVAALSVAEVLQSYVPEQVQIKWPNDIVIQGKKVCGILTEMSAQMDYINHIVIGIGINVNQQLFAEEVQEIGISLAMVQPGFYQRSQIIERILTQFEIHYATFLNTEDLSVLKPMYSSFLVNKGRQVRIIQKQEELIATARGINEKGELLIENSQNEIIEIQSGEVSVRGVYGYV